MAQVGFVRDDELGYEALVVAEGWWLEIQRGLESDQQDAALGQDAYCLVRDGAATHYGGVTTWTLAGDRLTLLLADEAARELGLATALHFTLDEAGQALVRDHLARLLS